MDHRCLNNEIPELDTPVMREGAGRVGEPIQRNAEATAEARDFLQQGARVALPGQGPEAISGDINSRQKSEQSRATSRKCEVENCSNLASFFIVIIVGSLQHKPKQRVNTRTIGVCDSCCNPHSGKWEALKRLVAFAVWNKRGDLIKSFERSSGDEACSDAEPGARGMDARRPPAFLDRKSAAAGGE